MGLKSHVIVFIFCLHLFSLSTVFSHGRNKGQREKSSRCRGWEEDLRSNLIAPGNITKFLERFKDSISTLSPGCVQSFSLNVSYYNLMKLMMVLNEKYDDLIPGTRKQIYKWVEDIYTKSSGPFGMNTMDSSSGEGSKPNGGKDKGKRKGKDKGKGSWITLDLLNILGRFIVQAPTSTFKGIARGETSTICQLFNSSSDLLDNLFDLKPVQARILIEGLNACGNVNISEDATIAKLGQLACFYPVKQLNMLNKMALKSLQTQLLNCTRNLKEIYRVLVANVNANDLTAEKVKELGAFVVGLKISQVSNISKEAIQGALSELKDVKGWSRGQIKVLVKKYNEIKEVTAKRLKDLGVLVSGLGAKSFGKFKGQELLDAFSQRDVAESSNVMLPVQKESIMKAILDSVKIDSVLQSLPESLVPQIPTGNLEHAGNISLEFLSKDKPWNLGQSVALINYVKYQLNKAQDISKLKTAVKGIPCTLIHTLKPDVVNALANNPHVSIDQIRCAASMFFTKKKLSQGNYFRSLTKAGIDEILASYLIFEPTIPELRDIPMSLCSNIVDLISQANISVLPLMSDRRRDLFKYAMECLKLNVSSLTEDQGASLGSLVCEFNAEEIKTLNKTVFLALIPQFRECRWFTKEQQKALRETIMLAFPTPSAWTVDELTLLDVLLTVLTRDDFKSIPNNDDIKIALEQILSTHKPTHGRSLKFSALYWKFFDILTKKTASNRKKRASECAVTPTFMQIEALREANSMWTVDQLGCISDEDFINSLDTLTEVTSFSTEQLKALKAKAMQAYGMNINNEQLASLERITLGFNNEEVKKYFTKPDIDTVGAISNYIEWSLIEFDPQASTIMKNFMNGRAYSNLSSTELVGLGYFICNVRPHQILSITSYRSAARDIGNKMCLRKETRTALKVKAVETFPNIKSWTGAQLQEIGLVAAGLTAEEVSELSTSAVSYLTPLAVRFFPPNVFSAMSSEQLRNLGPENYGAVTEAQKAALSRMQLDALNENIGSTGGAGTIYWNPVIMLTLLVLSLTVPLH